MKRNKIKNITIIAILMLFFIQCGKSKAHKSISSEKRKQYEERIQFTDEILENNFYKTYANNKTTNAYEDVDDQIELIKDRIETAIFMEEEKVDLRKIKKYLKKKNYFDLSYWKKDIVDIETAIYLMERTAYSLTQSKLSNDYFLFSDVEITIDTLEKNKYKINWNANSYNYMEMIEIYSFKTKKKRIEQYDLRGRSCTIKLKDDEKISGIYFHKMNGEILVKLQ